MKLYKVEFRTETYIIHWQRFFRNHENATAFYATTLANERRNLNCINDMRYEVTHIDYRGRKILDGYYALKEIETED